MADHGSMTGRFRPCVEQGFQPPGWALEEKRMDGGVLRNHRVRSKVSELESTGEAARPTSKLATTLKVD